MSDEKNLNDSPRETDPLAEPANESAIDLASSAPEKRRSARHGRRWFGYVAGWAARILALILLITAGTAWFAYNSAQREPDFYKAVLQETPETLAVAGDQFETRVVELQNSIQENGSWQTVFTQAQINGWLGSDMPEKFPDLLPPEVSDPRIAININDVQVAFRFKSPRLAGIVVIQGDVFSTGDNEIGVQIKSVRSGVVPLPVGQWADEIAESMRESGIPVRWTQSDGDPVAIISLPEQHLPQGKQQVVVDAIETRSGEVALSGATRERVSQRNEENPLERSGK